MAKHDYAVVRVYYSIEDADSGIAPAEVISRDGARLLAKVHKTHFFINGGKDLCFEVKHLAATMEHSTQAASQTPLTGLSAVHITASESETQALGKFAPNQRGFKIDRANLKKAVHARVKFKLWPYIGDTKAVRVGPLCPA